MVAVDCVWSRTNPGLTASLGPRQYSCFRRQRRPWAGEGPKITLKHAIGEPKTHSPQHCMVILTLYKLLCQNNSHRTRYLVVWIDLFQMCMSFSADCPHVVSSRYGKMQLSCHNVMRHMLSMYSQRFLIFKLENLKSKRNQQRHIYN